MLCSGLAIQLAIEAFDRDSPRILFLYQILSKPLLTLNSKLPLSAAFKSASCLLFSDSNVIGASASTILVYPSLPIR